MNYQLIHGLLALPASLLLLPSTQAQEDPQDLLKLRENYNSRLAETLRTTVGDYHKKLSAIEQESATKGDYANAHAAKARAAMLTIQFAELTGAPAAGFTLEASRASTSGSVSLDRSAGVLKKFSSAGSRATWDARQSTPDTYEVFMTYATASPVDNPAHDDDSSLPKKLVAGGTITIREATSLARSDESDLVATIEPTGSWDAFETVSLGTLTLASASTSIEIIATEVQPEGLMHLRELRFKRIAPPVDPSSPPPAALESLKDDHTKKLSAVLTPITDAYVASLEKLVTEVSASANLDAVVSIRAEIEKAKQSGAEAPLADQDLMVQGSIVLPAVDTLRVRTSGTTSASSKGYLTSIAPEGAFIEWDIQRLNLPPGFYEIGMRYRSTDKSGGTFSVNCGDSSFSGSIRRNDGFAPSAPFRDRPAGILYLVGSAAPLRLTVSSILPGGDSLCDLESVSLRLTDRDAFEQAKTSEAGGDNQWIKLEGARFVGNGELSGDNIRVTHGGKQLFIRLYGIDCPYLDATSRPGPNEAGKFGLNETQVAKIARDASRFTREALKSGPFIIFTKNQDASQNGKKDRIYAFIVTQQGLLSHQLVLAGLAKVDGTFSDAPAEINPGVTAEIHEMWLRGEEAKARKANRGMWQYKK